MDFVSILYEKILPLASTREERKQTSRGKERVRKKEKRVVKNARIS